MHPELKHDSGTMTLHRSGTDGQHGSNLLVGLSARKVSGNLALAFRERVVAPICNLLGSGKFSRLPGARRLKRLHSAETRGRMQQTRDRARFQHTAFQQRPSSRENVVQTGATGSEARGLELMGMIAQHRFNLGQTFCKTENRGIDILPSSEFQDDGTDLLDLTGIVLDREIALVPMTWCASGWQLRGDFKV